MGAAPAHVPFDVVRTPPTVAVPDRPGAWTEAGGPSSGTGGHGRVRARIAAVRETRPARLIARTPKQNERPQRRSRYV